MSGVFGGRYLRGVNNADDLKKVVSYDPQSGDFRWEFSPRSDIPAGAKAGHLCPKTGYVFLRINKVLYRAGRLAWLYVYGEWPERDLEYANGNRADNRISNLRIMRDHPKRKVPKKAKDGKAPILSVEYVRERLIYDIETGEFRWRDPAGKHGHIPAGSVAGALDKDGYRRISLYDYPFKAARLAFLYVTGSWPLWEVDHINNNPSDDRWFNLRLATPGQNKQNRRRPRNNVTGYKGVFVDKGRPGKYRAAIDAYGKRVYLGTFSSVEEAAQARDEAAIKMHGQFANLSDSSSDTKG